MRKKHVHKHTHRHFNIKGDSQSAHCGRDGGGREGKERRKKGSEKGRDGSKERRKARKKRNKRKEESRAFTYTSAVYMANSYTLIKI